MQSNISLKVINNGFEQDKIRTIKGSKLFDAMREVYPKGLPSNTCIYHEFLDASCDVTPANDDDVDYLSTLDGEFYVVTYPAEPTTLAIIAISVVASVAVAMLMPMPTVDLPNSSAPPSPNNSLSRRTNTERIGGRVPYILGTIRAIPDLLARTYTAFIDHEEVEFGLLCIGQGEYVVKSALDNNSDINYINGSTVLVYNPDASIGDSDSLGNVQTQFGSDLSEKETDYSRLLVKRYSAVNGQTLQPPDTVINDQSGQIVRVPVQVSQGTIDHEQMGDSSFNDFNEGDLLDVEFTESVVWDDGTKLNLSGEGFSLSDKAFRGNLTFDNTSSVNANWGDITSDMGRSRTVIALIKTQGATQQTVEDAEESEWVGPIYTDDDDSYGIMINFISTNGLYDQHPSDPKYMPFGVGLEVKTEKLDKNNDVIGEPIISAHKIEGRNATVDENGVYQWTTQASSRETAAATKFIYRSGRQRVWIRRKSNEIKSDEGRLPTSQEVKVKDLYTYRRITDSDINAPITKVVTKSATTASALSVKERKLYADLSRVVTNWRTGQPLVSNRIDDLIYFAATDPTIGNMLASDLNMEQISATVDANIAYFGTDKVAVFNGTFGSTDITTEETLQSIAAVGFITLYWFNNQIHAHFESANQQPVANFNSRNIVAGEYTYSESFGATDDKDGVSITFDDADNDYKTTTLHYPIDMSAVNPKKIEIKGITNKAQAWAHMMREYQKIMHSTSMCTFTGVDESGIVIPTHVVNVANQYRADTQQGAVDSYDIDGQPLLTLSDGVDFKGRESATIFVQTVIGTVDNITCYPTDVINQVRLQRTINAPISVDYDAVVQATYQFTTHDDTDKDYFIVTKKEDAGNANTHELTCINYDMRYYQHDLDYINGLIP